MGIKSFLLKKMLGAQLKKAGMTLSDAQLDEFVKFAEDPDNLNLMKSFEQKVKSKTDKGMNQMAAVQQVLRENPDLQQKLQSIFGGMAGK